MENEVRIERLVKGLQAVASLMGESEGVAGLHRNGEIANWDELLTGAWLEDYHAAMNEVIDMQHEAMERDQLQHEIRMTEDRHYADNYRQKQREEQILLHGIDE